MKNLRIAIEYCVFLSIIIYGCKGHSSTLSTPDIGIPENEINKRISLEAPQGWNTFKIGKVVNLNVKVISEDQIAFKYDYGAKIFMLKDDRWIEIPNLMEYPQGTILLSPPNGDPFKEGNASLDPIISKKNSPVPVRIVLIGNIIEGGQITNKQTAGFVDLILNP